jgi:hypothetical protein
MDLLGKGSVSEYEQAEVIGTLTLNSTEHKFTFFEVSLLPNDLLDEWRGALSADRANGSLMLLAELYLRRYAYEESEKVAQPGAPSVPAPSESEE